MTVDATGTADQGAGNPDAAAAAAAAAAGNPDAGKPVTQGADKGAEAAKSPAAAGADADPFADLDTDTRDWLSKREVKDAKAAAKLAHEQSKLLGNAIRIPGKDAKPEEIAAYEEKLGVPPTADGYELKVPKDLPENLPYDAERANAFKAKAKELKLSKAQAAELHDWAVGNGVADQKAVIEAENARKIETAKGETQKLIKLWGPLDGETAKANLAFADRALRDIGGDDAIAEFKRVGLIGEAGGVVMSAPIATMLAKAGAAIYKEDEVLKGRPDRLNNPFADGESFNLTAAMKMIKEDEHTAKSFIAAAGKKPADFGLQP